MCIAIVCELYRALLACLLNLAEHLSETTHMIGSRKGAWEIEFGHKVNYRHHVKQIASLQVGWRQTCTDETH